MNRVPAALVSLPSSNLQNSNINIFDRLNTVCDQVDAIFSPAITRLSTISEVQVYEIAKVIVERKKVELEDSKVIIDQEICRLVNQITSEAYTEYKQYRKQLGRFPDVDCLRSTSGVALGKIVTKIDRKREELRVRVNFAIQVNETKSEHCSPIKNHLFSWLWKK